MTLSVNALIVSTQKCEVDPMPAMKERLTKLEEIFVAQFMSATGDQLNSIASARFSFASRLYYRTLLSMLKQVSCAIHPACCAVDCLYTGALKVLCFFASVDI